MNSSVQNNSLSRLIVVPQRLFESIGRSPSIDTHFFDPCSLELIHFSGRAHSAPILDSIAAGTGVAPKADLQSARLKSAPLLQSYKSNAS
jgi:hypothetical protein